jgi:dTDP-4-amino-4,6-dideoxygalactose transaminase
VTENLIPMCDVQRETAALRSELAGAFERVLDSGSYILGAEVEQFEGAVSDYLDGAYAVGVASGTDALWLALRALDIGPGDKVVTSAFTFFATASAILLAGATPVLVDIDLDNFNLAVDQVAETLDSAGITAVLPVHLYGQPVDMKWLMSIADARGVPVVEDAAQALGAAVNGRPVGTIGALGCFSFFPTKNLGGFGDGGLVATRGRDLMDRVRLLRAHGARRKYHHEAIGNNSRLDALQAALLAVRLRGLDASNEMRRAHAAFYSKAFAPLGGVVVPMESGDSRHVYHQYTIRVTDGRRDALKEFLAAQHIQSLVYYPVPLHRQPAIEYLGHKDGDFPNAERASREVLSLPMFPLLREVERDRVAEAVVAFFNR